MYNVALGTRVTPTHSYTHARTYAHAHTRTHAHTCASARPSVLRCPWPPQQRTFSLHRVPPCFTGHTRARVCLVVASALHARSPLAPRMAAACRRRLHDSRSTSSTISRRVCCTTLQARRSTTSRRRGSGPGWRSNSNKAGVRSTAAVAGIGHRRTETLCQSGRVKLMLDSCYCCCCRCAFTLCDQNSTK